MCVCVRVRVRVCVCGGGSFQRPLRQGRGGAAAAGLARGGWAESGNLREPLAVRQVRDGPPTRSQPEAGTLSLPVEARVCHCIREPSGCVLLVLIRRMRLAVGELVGMLRGPRSGKAKLQSGQVPT